MDETGKNKVSILLVEDNMTAAIGARAILRKYIGEADMVHSGEEAVEKFAQYHYDIILMDLGLPNMTGDEAAAIIKQQYPASLVKILALSAHDDADQRAMVKDNAIDEFLSKPLNGEKCQFIIDNYIAHKS